MANAALVDVAPGGGYCVGNVHCTIHLGQEEMCIGFGHELLYARLIPVANEYRCNVVGERW